MKFNEVFLGEVGAEASELQDGGVGGGGGGSPLSLDQYISNAREALGVDSHYSRSLISLSFSFDSVHNKHIKQTFLSVFTAQENTRSWKTGRVHPPEDIQRPKIGHTSITLVIPHMLSSSDFYPITSDDAKLKQGLQFIDVLYF